MRLKELRKARNLKQIEVADFLSCSQGVYSRYENSDREPPFDIIVKLADFYGVTVDYLMGVEAAAQSQPIKTEKNESKEKALPSNEREAVPENRVLGRGEIATKYRQLSPKDKEIIDEMVRVLFEKASGEKGE